MLVPAVSAGLMDNKRPDGFYCELDSQCESGTCEGSICLGVSRAGDENAVIAFIRTNSIMIRNIILLGLAVMIYLYVIHGKSKR